MYECNVNHLKVTCFFFTVVYSFSIEIFHFRMLLVVPAEVLVMKCIVCGRR